MERRVCLICLLILGSSAFTTDTSDEEYENIRILMTSSEGLQFFKEDSPEGIRIVYDCELGLRNNGTIRICDGIHPRDMESLVVKNCNDVTLANDCDTATLQNLKINNVNSLTLERYSYLGSYYGSSSRVERDIFSVSIRNVRFLSVKYFFDLQFPLTLNLKLQNVLINNLSKEFRNNNLVNLHLKNVKIKEAETGAIHLDGESNLTVEDSYFERVHTKAFVLRGEVQIINSTFDYLDEAAFSVNTSSSFVFSGNKVKRMLNPFYISGPEVDITNNTFDSIVNPWLPKIIGPESKFFKVVNITGNTINHWSHNLFYTEPRHFPDIFVFEGNYLNCSCKNALLLSYKFQDYVTEVFLNKVQKNVCYNFGNCPLYKIVGKGSQICSGTFQCPEDERNEDDEKATWPSHLSSILTVLKNIDIKLDHIVSKYNSSVIP